MEEEEEDDDEEEDEDEDAVAARWREEVGSQFLFSEKPWLPSPS